jgi:hypothetical protein
MLYRAQRVNVDPNFNFLGAAPGDVEDRATVVSIDSCTEPPFDKPPYTNGCGDFLLLDRATFVAVRGFDETGRILHNDSRFAQMPMILNLRAKLIGDIYHISHSKSLINKGAPDPSELSDHLADFPYLNGPDWGLAQFHWTRVGDRLLRVSASAEQASAPTPWPELNGGMLIPSPDPLEGMSSADIGWARQVRRQLVRERTKAAPAAPIAGVSTLSETVNILEKFESPWSAEVRPEGSAIRIKTLDQPWRHSAIVNLPDRYDESRFYWVDVEVKVDSGTVGLSLLSKGQFDKLSGEKILGSSAAAQRIFFLLKTAEPSNLLIRNGPDPGGSNLSIQQVQLVSGSKQVILNYLRDTLEKAEIS